MTSLALPIMQNWIKLGRVFETISNKSWMITHAAVPTIDFLSTDLLRVYFGTRDKDNRASINFFDFNMDSRSVSHVSNSPILTPGQLGTFDDSGVLPSWVIKSRHRTFMYYIGWNLGVTVPFRNFIGLAIKETNNDIFKRYSQAPLADRDKFDPFFYTNPCILIENGVWKMWYLSSVGWETINNTVSPKYHIKYDESEDGIHWKRNPGVAIEFNYANEHAISRPSVMKQGNLYKMWYSYRSSPRGETYRIGYAESFDGKKWIRKDEEVGLDVSKEGWDSEMIEYPFVFEYKGQTYMFYNGNGYGKTGIGLAKLEI